jgi:hypothetical protein
MKQIYKGATKYRGLLTFLVAVMKVYAEKNINDINAFKLLSLLIIIRKFCFSNFVNSGLSVYIREFKLIVEEQKKDQLCSYMIEKIERSDILELLDNMPQNENNYPYIEKIKRKCTELEDDLYYYLLS